MAHTIKHVVRHLYRTGKALSLIPNPGFCLVLTGICHLGFCLPPPGFVPVLNGIMSSRIFSCVYGDFVSQDVRVPVNLYNLSGNKTIFGWVGMGLVRYNCFDNFWLGWWGWVMIYLQG